MARVLAIVAALSVCGAFVQARASAATADLTRLDLGANAVAPGSEVLLRVSYASAQPGPVSLKLDGLPVGVTVRSGDARCQGQTCTVDAAGGKGQADLVLRVAPTVDSGTVIPLTVTADTSTRSASIVVRRSAPPQFGLEVRADGGAALLPGRVSTLTARLTPLSGHPREVRIAGLLPPGSALLRARGAGWDCSRTTCRVRAQGVAQTTSARLRVRIPARVSATPVSGGSRTAGRFADLRWVSRIGQNWQRVEHSALVQLRAPRPPRPSKPAVSVPNWTQRPHLEMLLRATPIRPRGTGQIVASVLHNRVSHTRGPTRLTIDLPRGVHRVAARDRAWRCRGSSQVRCVLARPISAARPAPRITLTVRASDSVRPSSRARAAVRWGTGSGTHTDRHALRLATTSPARAVDASHIPLMKRLRVKASSTARVVPGSIKGRPTTVVLNARITGTTERQRPSYRWRQTSGPKVVWRGPKAQRIGQARVAVPVRLPRVDQRRTLRFSVTTRATGAVARDRVSIIVTPRDVARFVVRDRAPRMRTATFAPLTHGLRVPTAAPAKPSTPSVRAKPAMLSRAGSQSGFCAAFSAPESVSLRVGPGTVALGATSVTGSSCSAPGAQLAFSNANLKLGSHSFTGVTGTLTAGGLAITSGGYIPPKSWRKALRYLDQLSLRFTMPGSSAVTAPWSGRSLGNLGGSVTFDEFLFLDLPGGWTGQTTLTFAAAGLQLAADGADGGSGQVSVTGDVALDGTFSTNAQLTDIVTLSGANGAQSALSGSGTIEQSTASGPVTYSVAARLASPLEILDGFTITRLTAAVDNTGVSLSGAATVGQTSFALTGSYASAATWSMNVTQAGSWVSPDITISGLSGKIRSQKSVVTLTLTGDAGNLDLPDAITVTDLAARLTNACPAKASGCQADQIRLQLALAGSLQLGTSSTTFSGTANVDLTTMNVTGRLNLRPLGFGPDGMQLRDVQLQIGGPVKGICPTKAAGSEPVSITATLSDVFGDDSVKLNGEINDAGVCFTGEANGFSPTGTSADSAFTDVVLVYASYATTVKVPTASAPVPIQAGTLGLYGSFTAPDALSSALGGLPATGTFQAVVTDQTSGLGFDGDVDWTFQDPLYVTGSAGTGQSSLTLTTVSLDVDLSGTSLTVNANATGAYFTPAASNGTSAASTVPLTVSVGVDLTAATFQFSAAAAGGRTVSNAFGQAGLTLSDLVVAGSIGATDSLGFSAQAVLPPAWVSSVGVQPDTPVSLIIDISATPCLQFSIGRQNQTTAAIDVLNEGVLVADYANVLLAPLGCSFANVDIAPGFALDFDGLIAGDPFAFNAALGLGSAGFSLNASIAIGQMQIGAVDLQNSTFALILDPSQSVLTVSFGSTVQVSGSSLQVAGSYASNAGTVTASFSAVSTGNVDVAGFDFNNADVDFTYAQSAAGSTLTFTLNGAVSFLDQSIAGTLALTAQNGAVQTASGDLDVSVSLLVVDVAGELQFSYQAGQGASATFSNGTVTVIDLFTFDDVNGSLAPSGAYEVSAYTEIPSQNASEADTWLNVNESGYFNTVFSGTLGVAISGGNGQSVSVDYSNSTVSVWSQWKYWLVDDYGSLVPIPVAGCEGNSVTPGSLFSEPVLNFYLNPYAVEWQSTDDGDDDTNSCVSFTSIVEL